MKIIPLMVVLICASGRWRHHGPLSPWMAAASAALEIRIPLLGRVKMEFQTDTTSAALVDGLTTEGQTGTAKEGQPKEYDGMQKAKLTEAPLKVTEAEASTNMMTVKDKSTEALKDGDTQQPEPTTVAEANKTTEVTTAKDGNQTEKSKPNQDAATTSAAPADGSTTERQSETVSDGESKEDDGKQVTKSTAIIDKDKPTEAPATTVTIATNDVSKQQPEATTVAEANQPTEAATEANDNGQTEEPKPNQDAASDPDDDFDDSDIWDDTEDPPKEFGRQYDLDPGLLDSAGNGLGDFQPKLLLPPNMTRDMFFESPAERKLSDQRGDQEENEDAESNGFFNRLKRFFSIANIKEQLDTIPGKMQALVDRFRQKKSDGLKKLREKMDGSAEKLGQKIAEAFSKLKPPKQSPQQCVGQIEESFKQYEAALQGGIQPCMDKIQSVTNRQEGALRNAQAKFSRMLTDMQSCVNKLDSSGVDSFVKSILNVGSCTKKNIQSRIEDSLQPQMTRLSEMFQQQGSKLNGNMDAAGRCVERKLQLPEFQKMQQELVEKGKQCLERSSSS